MFGWRGAFLAPIMTAFSLINLSQELANAYGDSQNGRAKYDLTITRQKPNVLASYVGQWVRHVSNITVNADGTGTQLVGFGAIGNGCGNDLSYCSFNSKLTFAPSSDGKSIIGTYTSVWYTADQTVIPTPPGMQDEPVAGDTMRLQLDQYDRLNITMLGRLDYTNSSWDVYGGQIYCGSQTPNDQQMPCGA